MFKTDYTVEAKQVIGGFVRRAGKTFLVIHGCDVLGEENPIRITPDEVAEFYANQAGNILSGCRTLAGLTGDWRPMSELAKAALDWFKLVNVTGMRRAALRVGLVPRF